MACILALYCILTQHVICALETYLLYSEMNVSSHPNAYQLPIQPKHRPSRTSLISKQP
ncbi:hypothetical protein BDV41DRAFT_516881 [Aspergillus transmontanensis]|uniref:Uncharacterized protein n=1 Tax=Aspergillus transmontanensis TaxID=1034304 RepID=A0A5N6WH37_9EURO|nr:hypothetical protein BDV41DRAFT_516881 [Aspergillus transmontanensis]